MDFRIFWWSEREPVVDVDSTFLAECELCIHATAYNLLCGFISREGWGLRLIVQFNPLHHEEATTTSNRTHANHQNTDCCWAQPTSYFLVAMSVLRCCTEIIH